jgi:hypothetical protein
MRHLLADQDTLGMQTSNRSLPQQLHARGLRPGNHEAMQDGAADANATPVREACIHAQAATDKTYPAKRVGTLRRNVDPQLREGSPAIGH